MTKTTTLGLRLDPGLKAQLQKLAKDDRRSLSSYIEIVLSEHIEKIQKKSK